MKVADADRLLATIKTLHNGGKKVGRFDVNEALHACYREAGQFKSSYAADQAVFPLVQDRIGIAVILLLAFVVIPVTGSSFLIQAIMIPFLIFSLARPDVLAVDDFGLRAAMRDLYALADLPKPAAMPSVRMTRPKYIGLRVN